MVAAYCATFELTLVSLLRCCLPAPACLPACPQEATGFHLEVATVRRLEYENDTFAFGDKLVSKWYPGAAKVGAQAGGRAAGDCNAHKEGGVCGYGGL